MDRTGPWFQGGAAQGLGVENLITKKKKKTVITITITVLSEVNRLLFRAHSLGLRIYIIIYASRVQRIV